MADGDRPLRRRGGFRVGLAALCLLGSVAVAASLFRLGLTAGLALTGGVVVVSLVPAGLLGWPLLSLEAIPSIPARFLDGILSATQSLFG